MKNKKSNFLIFGTSFLMALSFLFLQGREASAETVIVFKFDFPVQWNLPSDGVYTKQQIVEKLLISENKEKLRSVASAERAYSYKCQIKINGITRINDSINPYYSYPKDGYYNKEESNIDPIKSFDSCVDLFTKNLKGDPYVYKTSGVVLRLTIFSNTSAGATNNSASAPANTPLSNSSSAPASDSSGSDPLTGGSADTSSGGTGAGDADGNQTSTTNSMGGIVFINPLGDVTTLEGFLMLILRKLRGLVGLLAVLFIVIGGIMYIFSGVDQGMATKGRQTVTYAVIGLAIALGANTFLVEIYDILEISSPGGLGLYDIAYNILKLALSLVGILAILGIVIGGMFYFGAGVNEGASQKGKKIVTASVIGLLMALSAVIIVREVIKLMT